MDRCNHGCRGSQIGNKIAPHLHLSLTDLMPVTMVCEVEIPIAQADFREQYNNE